MGLAQHQPQHARALSGGAWRKLSLGIAFLEALRTVVLDEPTSRVDPCSCRGVWDMLLEYQESGTRQRSAFSSHCTAVVEGSEGRIPIRHPSRGKKFPRSARRHTLRAASLWCRASGGCSASLAVGPSELVTPDVSGHCTHPRWAPFWSNSGITRRGVPAIIWKRPSIFSGRKPSHRDKGWGLLTATEEVPRAKGGAWAGLWKFRVSHLCYCV